jgi:hypothetical protein
MMVPVMAGVPPPGLSRLEILTVWPVHKDYTFIRCLYNTISLKTIIHESSLFIGPTPSPRARLAVAARARLLADETNYIFNDNDNDNNNNNAAAADNDDEGEHGGVDVSVNLCLGWRTGARDTLCRVKGLERAFASLQPAVHVGSVEEEYYTLKGATGSEDLLARSILDTRKKHAEFVPNYETLCAGGGAADLCARLPEEHRPDGAAANQYFSLKMMRVEDSNPAQYVLLDMDLRPENRPEMKVDPSEVLVPPMLKNKGGSRVKFIKGEPVLARWPDDRSTAFYTADVLELLSNKKVRVRFSWIDEAGEAGEVGEVVYATRDVKDIRVVRQMTTPEDERRDDDFIDDLVMMAQDVDESDDEDEEDDRTCMTTAPPASGSRKRRKQPSTPSNKQQRERKNKKKRRNNP